MANWCGSYGLAPLDAPLAAIKTRPIPHQGEKGLITVTESRAKTAGLVQFSARRSRRKHCGADETVSQLRFLYLFVAHRDWDLVVGADPHRTLCFPQTTDDLPLSIWCSALRISAFSRAKDKQAM